jgi:hypothetical protein
MITKGDYIEREIDSTWIAQAGGPDLKYIHFRFCGRRYKSWATKVKDKPSPGSEVRVFFKDMDFLTRKNADYFIFARVNMDLSTGWIIGQITWERLVRIGRVVRKGETEAGSTYLAKSSAVNVEIRELDPVFKVSFEKVVNDFSGVRIR